MGTKLKYLTVEERDFDIHGDYLIGEAKAEFIHGGYSHVVCGGEVCEATAIEYVDGTFGVLIGESVSNDLWRE